MTSKQNDSRTQFTTNFNPCIAKGSRTHNSLHNNDENDWTKSLSFSATQLSIFARSHRWSNKQLMSSGSQGQMHTNLVHQCLLCSWVLREFLYVHWGICIVHNCCRCYEYFNVCAIDINIYLNINVNMDF